MGLVRNYVGVMSMIGTARTYLYAERRTGNVLKRRRRLSLMQRWSATLTVRPQTSAGRGEGRKEDEDPHPHSDGGGESTTETHETGDRFGRREHVPPP